MQTASQSLGLGLRTRLATPSKLDSDTGRSSNSNSADEGNDASGDNVSSDEDAVFMTPLHSRSRILSADSAVDGDGGVSSVGGASSSVEDKNAPLTPLMQSVRRAARAGTKQPTATTTHPETGSPEDPMLGRSNTLTVKRMIPALKIGPYYRQFIRYTRRRGQRVGLALLEPVHRNQVGMPNGVFVSNLLPCGAASTAGAGAATTTEGATCASPDTRSRIARSAGPDGAAQPAHWRSGGFQAGDRIIEVNAVNTEVMTLAEVSELLDCSVGEIVVTVSRVVPVETKSSAASVSGRPHKHVSIATARGCGSVTHPVSLPMMEPIGRARNVIVHRHPNSGSLHIAIETQSFHMGTLPQITFDNHPSSPDAPLIEGGVLQNGDELLEVDGVVVVGLWPVDKSPICFFFKNSRGH